MLLSLVRPSEVQKLVLYVLVYWTCWPTCHQTGHVAVRRGWDRHQVWLLLDGAAVQSVDQLPVGMAAGHSHTGESFSHSGTSGPKLVLYKVLEKMPKLCDRLKS